MNAQSALLLLGGLLLLIAIVGGGIEIRELKIPKVERIPRVICAVAGAFFLHFGMSGSDDSRVIAQDGSAQVSERLAAGVGAKVRFVIFDRLTDEGRSLGQGEQASVKIDGDPVGHLTTSAQFPVAELVVTVAAEGQHSFAIEATMTQTLNGKSFEVNCFGAGMIDITNGSRFSFEGRFDERGGPCLLWLEKTQWTTG
jgi:hypothetical protein